MKLLVIIATVVAFTSAAPMSELLHPSPVNPDVLVDIKPEEKIILVTDPIEIAKFKRETKQPLYPTVLPAELNHHGIKREHKPSNHQQIPRDPLPLQRPEPPKKPNVNQRNRREVEPIKVTQTLPAATEAPVIQTSSEVNSQKPNENDAQKDKVEVTTKKSPRVQGLPALFSPSKEQKRDVSGHQNPTEASKDSSNEKQTHECKPEDLTQPNDSKTKNQHKRDIPVPLVPKHHHPEETSKESNEKIKSQHESLDVHHDLHNRKEHEVAFQKPQILPSIPHKSIPETQQHKRDIPVALVPKHQHPDLAPKESDEKNAHEENYHIQEHAAQDNLQIPQVLPAILNESPEEVKQHKRDIPAPLVPKHQYPQQSPKESNEKNSHEENHHIQEHVAQDNFRKHQVLPAILNESPEEVQQHKRDIPVPLVPKHQHPEESKEKDSQNNQDSNVRISHEGFQKPQILPAILHDSSVETQHERDIPVPLVSKHHHSEGSLKDDNVKRASEDKKDSESENHYDLHHTKEGFQKPQVLPASITETSADTQHKRDISVSMITEQHQPEDSEKKSNEKNSEKNKNLQEEKPNADANHKENNEKVEAAQHLPATQQIPQTLPAHNHHIPHYQLHQRQTNPENHFQPKDHNDYHRLNVENYNFHQSLKVQNNQHITTEQNHKLQVLPVHNQEQGSASLQNHQISLGHKNPQVHKPENVAATNFLNPKILPNHNQEHVAFSDFPKTLTSPTINQHLPILQKPETQPTLPMLNQHHGVLQQPETQPAGVKEITESNSQIKRDVSTNSRAVQQSHEHKTEDENKNQGNHPNPDEVQVEDLSEPKPLHKPHLHHVHLTHSKQQQNIPEHSNPDEVQVENLSEPKPLHQAQVHNMQITNSEHKPNVLDDHLSGYNVQSSTTTEHPLIRHQPVSVAELFSRPHDN